MLVSNSIQTHNNMSSFKKISNTSSKNNDRSKCNNNNAIKTPFCKVCFDAKRPGYDAHFLKADGLSTGNVVCPYLLSLECKYCKKPGHTVSYCDVLASKNQTQQPQETRREKSKLHQDADGWVTKSSSSSRNSQEGRFYIKGLPETTSTTQNAAFAHAPRILFEDDDEEEEVIAEVVVVKTPQPMGEWAAIAAKKPVPKPIRITTDMLFQGAKRAATEKQATEKLATEKQAAKTETKPWPQMILTRNWADDSDDDDE